MYHFFIILCRLSLPLNVIRQKREDEEDIWTTGLHERYIARPETPSFENMTLATFASNYKYTSKKVKATNSNSDDESDKEISTDSNCYPLINCTGYMKKRKKPAIIRYPKPNKEVDSEIYYHHLLKLHFPHRTSTLHFPGYNTLEHFYMTGKILNEPVSSFIAKQRALYEHNFDVTMKAWDDLQQGINFDEVWG